MSKGTFDNQKWVKLVKEYYKDVKMAERKSIPQIKVCVMSEVENFAEWLTKKGIIKND
jgi:hypothetical protein